MTRPCRRHDYKAPRLLAGCSISIMLKWAFSPRRAMKRSASIGCRGLSDSRSCFPVHELACYIARRKYRSRVSVSWREDKLAPCLAINYIVIDVASCAVSLPSSCSRRRGDGGDAGGTYKRFFDRRHGWPSQGAAARR